MLREGFFVVVVVLDLVLLFYFVLAKTPGEDWRFWEEVIMLGESPELPSCRF